MKKILFISYYFSPEKTVAAQRVSYWAKNIKEHVDIDIEVDVITASEQCIEETSRIDNIFHVSNSRTGLLGHLFKSDLGATWFYDLKKHFSKNKKKYDVVVITGNPFLHFFIAKILKNTMGCKIVLDFRDPFAKNERNASTALSVKLKRKMLVLFEYFFCEFADKIIVMNEGCKKLLCSRQQEIIEIIDNGYDEKSLNNATKKITVGNNSKKTIVYLGSFAVDRNIDNLLTSNKALGFAFDILHIGKPLEGLDNHKGVTCTGLVSYSDAVGYAKGADIGLILASGKAFESTTKIFDYIGLGLPILIITNGEAQTGNIHEVTKDYPAIWWASNNEQSIIDALQEIMTSELNYKANGFSKEKFSRKHGLGALVNFIDLKKTL
ncbi:hypothetical protein [Pseudoalteromonas sp. meg-B1]|uniref:hypothetical protein n=1 Tax=Pseudoalteromonas sp. meg-B1 TaxID=2203192 RepID=UPI000D70083D|nr:hypothetical protein [Pseudoalteromonas sp. meg-B1]PWS54344.1 hypothetical protein DK924_13015 [Pseudoalteromonas sp. meg-B1]